MVAGNGNSNAIISYHFEDHSFTTEERFYRIRQVDFDGAYEYSAVMRLSGDAHHAAPAVAFPTVISLQKSTTPQITLSNLAEGITEIQVYDLGGRIHAEQQLNINHDGSTAVFSLGSQLTTGYYLLNIGTAAGTQSIRLLVTQ